MYTVYAMNSLVQQYCISALRKSSPLLFGRWHLLIILLQTMPHSSHEARIFWGRWWYIVAAAASWCGADEDVFPGWWEASWDIVGEILWMVSSPTMAKDEDHHSVCVTELTRPLCENSYAPLWSRTMSSWMVQAEDNVRLSPANPKSNPLWKKHCTIVHKHRATHSKHRTGCMCCTGVELQLGGRIQKRRGLARLVELPHLLLRGTHTLSKPSHCIYVTLQQNAQLFMWF